jgi:hypothetical protein
MHVIDRFIRTDCGLLLHASAALLKLWPPEDHLNFKIKADLHMHREHWHFECQVVGLVGKTLI